MKFLDCTSGHCLLKNPLQLMFVSVFTSRNSENKRTNSAQVRLHCVLLKKNSFCIMNKIKLVWFYSWCRNYFLSKNVIFSYILKIFFYHVTLENIFRILNNFVYFQNIVVCNEPLTVTLKWENVNYSKSTYISKLPHILQKKLGLLQVCSLNKRKC